MVQYTVHPLTKLSHSFHFVVFFCCESVDVDPVPVLDGLLESFLFSVTVSCPFFHLGSLVSLCHVRLVSMVGRC